MAFKKPYKSILILGAGSDMAVALIKLLRNKWQKCTFHLLARDIEPLKELKEKTEQMGHEVHLYIYDLLHPTDLHFTEIEYCIVYAGWLPPNNDEAEKSMIVNSTGIQHFLNKFIPQNKNSLEHLIVTGSIAGVRVRPSNHAYGAAKANLHKYVLRLQKKNQHTITLAIPGYVRTKMLEGHKTLGLLTVTPEKMAEKYLDYFDTKPRIAYSHPAWRLIGFVLKMIPGFIMKRMKF